MPATITDQQPKVQPWKAHWSPVDMKSASANQNYMLDKNTSSLLIDGCVCFTHFSELACSGKETEVPKAQPWKAHWSPVDVKSASANQNYMTDDTGSLLIDGVCTGPPYSELVCTSQETGAPKAQPWKAHWSPVDVKSASANQNYMTDDTGSLLIDGVCTGPPYSELACTRKAGE